MRASEAEDEGLPARVVFAMLGLVLVLTLVCLLGTACLQRRLGEPGMARWPAGPASC